MENNNIEKTGTDIDVPEEGKKPSKKRKTADERIEDISRRISQMQAEKKRLESQVKQKERKERTKRLVNAGAAVEAVMKEKTNQESYPVEGENLEKILDILRQEKDPANGQGDVNLTDDQKRYIRAGEAIESLMKNLSGDDGILLEGNTLKHIQDLIQKENVDNHYIRIGKIVEDAVPITDFDIWEKYIAKYADPIKKYQAGEWKIY